MNFNDLINISEERITEFNNFKKLGLLCLNDDFVPAIHYPSITKYPPISYDEMFLGYTPPENKLMDVYIHIPFCSTKCIFCHYPSLYNAHEAEKDKYLDALDKEMDIYIRKLGLEKIKLRVALVGGGTPTNLNPRQLERFLKIFTDKCDLSSLKQFNFDVSPSNLVGQEGLEKLKIMKDFGVDRLTIGIQSLNENILRQMNRSHDKAIALKSIKNTLANGYKLNIEFIFGYPNQTLESWYQDLEEMITLDAHEIQFYRLKVQAYGDQQGSIKKIKENNPQQYPSIENVMRMKQMSILYLEDKGFYENLRRVFTKDKSNISLYAYNQCCNLYDQMAFGLTAFSSLRDRFVLNTQNFNDYYRLINEGKLPYNRGIIRSQEQQERWALILPLKNYNIRKNVYKEATGIDITNTKYYNMLQNLKQYDFIEENENIIQLTKKGAYYADEICQLFYLPEFIPFDKSLYNEGPLNPYTVTHNNV